MTQNFESLHIMEKLTSTKLPHVSLRPSEKNTAGAISLEIPQKNPKTCEHSLTRSRPQ
jgi:hypothetical protein